MLITVFTPTYNRANTITRLFESLLRQQFYDFEWLIVDDGSTDNTAEVVASFDSKGEFPIRYIKKNNGGKHTAYNVGLDEARGHLFFDVDSDDWLEDDSLLRISRLADKVLSTANSGGIIALKSFQDGSLIGKAYREDGVYRTFREIELSGQKGERSIVFKTAVAKSIKFPIIEGERFLGESVVYDQFKEDKFYILNQSLTICEYQPEGLSSNIKRLMLNNPGGYMMYFRNRIDMSVSFKERLGYILRYNFFRSKYKGKSVEEYSGKHSLLIAMLRPLNIIVSHFYK